MAKTKTPFFSLGARGSVGGSVTAQKRGQNTLIRTKPLPSDPYSLPQAYRRWLYNDYAHLWTQQSSDTHQSYRSLGARYHLTGFQYWMSVMLKTLPDILVWTRLDEKLGAVARDSGKLGNHAVITGASPTTLGIDGGYHFDGLNDKITYPENPSLNSLDSFTIEFLFSQTDKTNSPIIIGNRDLTPGAYGYKIYTNAGTGILTAFFDNALGVTAGTSGFDVCDGLIHHCAITRQNPDYVLYIDGQVVANFAKGGLITSTDPTVIGKGHRILAYWPGDIDNVIIYSRALDPATVRAHSLRRYPP